MLVYPITTLTLCLDDLLYSATASQLHQDGSRLLTISHEFSSEREATKQYEWLEDRLSTWPSHLSYFNIRFRESCRYMIFGVPFSEREAVPHPYQVALVLLNSFQEGHVSPNPHAPPLPEDTLHRIERDWDMEWGSLPEYQQVDRFQLLAVSLPRLL